MSTYISWISVKERLPERGDEYLVWFADGCWDTSYFYHRKQEFSHGASEEITHWAYPPLGPEATS